MKVFEVGMRAGGGGGASGREGRREWRVKAEGRTRQGETGSPMSAEMVAGLCLG